MKNLSEAGPDDISLIESDGDRNPQLQHHQDFLKNIASQRIKKIIQNTENYYDPTADWQK